jgi:mRNA interferase YafQ
MLTDAWLFPETRNLDWAGRRECHVESDWLLIYKLDEARIVFERTGTHADLFD